MISALLRPEVQVFIRRDHDLPLHKLVLKGSPFPDISMTLLAQQIASREKCKHKLPLWYRTKNIIYPKTLNIEQSSSEITANYKATIAKGDTLLDLTAGFGSDCVAFGESFNKVIACEKDQSLAEIAAHNAVVLGVNNVYIQAGNGITYLGENEIEFDWIFLDPSRRHEKKGKTILLEDYEPDILPLLPMLLRRTHKLLLKTAPMLDISRAIEQLKCVQEVHVVGLRNEMKELLFVLNENVNTAPEIKAIDLETPMQGPFVFTYPDLAVVDYDLPKTYLYEPNAALLKAGAFDAISEKFGLSKLHRHSHLYTSDTLIDFPGRRFRIITTVPYNRKRLQEVLPEKKANITTRNFPIGVHAIRKKTGIRDGSSHYLFFTTDLSNKRVVIVGEKL
jgi:hypothetical protein